MAIQEEEVAQKVGMVKREAEAVVLRGSLAVLVTVGGTLGVVTQEALAARAEGKVGWQASAGAAWCCGKSRHRMCRSTHALRCFCSPSSDTDRSSYQGPSSFALRRLPCNATRRRT